MNLTDNCPRCASSWDAGPIPEHELKHFGGETRFSRLILVKMRHIDAKNDHFQCPDCKATFEDDC